MTSEGSLNGVLLLALELQRLDRVPRMGYALRGVSQPESVTEHSWHVLFLACSLAPHVPDLELAKVLQIALVHDLAEVRTGDLPWTAGQYFEAGAKSAAEGSVMSELLKPLGTSAQAAFREYQERTTPEARFVKGCDKLQLMLKVAAYESWGTGDLSEFWNNPANFEDGGFPLLKRAFDWLREHRAAGKRQNPG